MHAAAKNRQSHGEADRAHPPRAGRRPWGSVLRWSARPPHGRTRRPLFAHSGRNRRQTLSTDRNTGFGGRYEPFRTFTLHRGETRYVRLEFRLADCDPAAFQPGGSSTLADLALRYRILGITRTADAPFRDSTIAVQAAGECAHPIIKNDR